MAEVPGTVNGPGDVAGTASSDCAKLLFKQREPGKRMPDDAIIGAWWAVVTLFPVPFFIV